MGRLILLCALVLPVPEWQCLPDGTCILDDFQLQWTVDTRNQEWFDSLNDDTNTSFETH